MMLKQKEERSRGTEYQYGSDGQMLTNVAVPLPNHSQVPPL
jgi:hypothetical protein